MSVKQYMNRVAELGCIVCRNLGIEGSPAELHHIRAAAGAGQRSSDWLVIPACSYHHRGSKGLHGDRSSLKQIKADELSLLADTIEALNR